MSTIHQILTRYWGFSSFRELQQEIIESVLEGNDVLGLMPTGGGKSLTFQVPALAREGICLVISPLIALMKDQVQNLLDKGIKAQAMYSGMTSHEMEVAFENCAYGNYKFLYLSPERINTRQFKEKLHLLNVNLIAVDEAHCISQWGYDFRPSYLRIAELRKLLPDVPVLALTATATPEVVDDIQEKLCFKKKNVFRKSFERTNLSYLVRNVEDKNKYLLRIINQSKGSGIVYTRNRKSTREIALFLVQQNIRADYYHAGLSNAVRNRKQEDWMSGRTRVIVATNAFGMGIDKADVRFVVHVEVPDSPEAYFQEAGRAGRDGKTAYAVLLFSPEDEIKIKTRLSKKFPPRKKIKEVYQALCNYCQVAIGEGKDMVFDFVLFDFCNKFKFDYTETYNSLKILEQEDYIQLTHEVDNPSKLIFLVHRDELYKFQVANARFDAVIKLILRSYSGLFNDYVRINEDEIAKRLNTSRETVYEILSALTKQKIINYIPAKKTPFVIFTTERLDNNALLISRENYDFKRRIYEKKLNAMLNYATAETLCRSVILLEYFGQKNPNRCGNCDYCKQRNELNINQYEMDGIVEQIKKLATADGIKLEDMVDKISFPKTKTIDVIRWLFEAKKLQYNSENKVVWNTTLFNQSQPL